jgi:hypothetical protein
VSHTTIDRRSETPWAVTLQLVLAVAGLLWGMSLFPLTSWVWWIRGNLVYGAIGLLATLLYYHGHTGKGRIAALIGLAVFALSNAVPGALACTTGGACKTVAAVTIPLLVCQVAVIVMGTIDEGESVSAAAERGRRVP